MGDRADRQRSTTPRLEGQVDAEWLGRDLLGAWAERRLAARRKVADPRYQRLDDLSMAEHRARVLEQMHALVDDGAVHAAFPTRFGGGDDHGGNIAGFEELVLADPSLQIKSGVQYGLFGAAVLHLGTQRHHDELLPAIISLDLPGAFAMTETGHGSDVASIATTATYDEATEEFVIHTPFRGAWKDYLGNAALHGKHAVVFAKLITKGVDHGVHAFSVPLRDDDGAFLPGIGGEDDGVKGGLNGIDNGRLHFTNVRIPRTSLLNRYGDVAPDGTYSSPIDSPGRRFFTMLGTLVQGRVSLDGAAVVAQKAALAIAIRYASERRQFNASSATHEEVLLDYRRHQRRLFTRLAKAYAQSYAHEILLAKFDGVFSGRTDTAEEREDLETLAAGLKALSTWQALDTIQEAREACGGAGFLAENRLVQLRADLDVYVTFEGDNTVLLQLVGKRLLGDFSKQFKGASKADIARFAADQLFDRATALVGLRSLSQDVRDLRNVKKSSLALRDRAVQRDLLEDRVETMVADIAGRLRHAPKDQAGAAAAFNDEQHALIEAARAWVELQQYDALDAALARMPEPTRKVMTHIRDLFALTVIEEHAAWHLEQGRLSGARSQAVTSTIDRLLQKLRPHALDLVTAFGLRDEHLRASIATGAEGERQAAAMAHYEALRAAGTLPVPEKRKRASEPGAQPIAEAGAAPVPPTEVMSAPSPGSAPSPASAPSEDAADDEHDAELAAR
ncbi:acyl-CoA dehydrogenase [Agrococcus sp. HG114]|uniref:acyl-CoA dehydrogenase family protein n=1 Tax=Agrococcus sp. HG114 TaxID=2969757 RepID=UPI00215B2772|nr:acyl-CoA dehydrogenase [Agrococcus sp. HG114]MCR8670036.1 acyl-CoA dehydrogenase family protein [Agrococcus sp. HG114]